MDFRSMKVLCLMCASACAASCNAHKKAHIYTAGVMIRTRSPHFVVERKVKQSNGAPGYLSGAERIKNEEGTTEKLRLGVAGRGHHRETQNITWYCTYEVHIYCMLQLYAHRWVTEPHSWASSIPHSGIFYHVTT